MRSYNKSDCRGARTFAPKNDDERLFVNGWNKGDVSSSFAGDRKKATKTNADEFYICPDGVTAS